jgi:hypothetical protein
MHNEWNHSRTFPCDGPGCSEIASMQRTHWYRVDTPKEEREKHYCCNACRQRAYRQRHPKSDRHIKTVRRGMKSTVT